MSRASYPLLHEIISTLYIMRDFDLQYLHLSSSKFLFPALDTKNIENTWLHVLL
jgi:hypothetical protein